MGKDTVKPWHEERPEDYAELRRLIESKLPTLHVSTEGRRVFIRGSLPLMDPEGSEEIDRYDIEIQLPLDHPKSLPIVREIGGRLSKIADRHFSISGGACLFVREERWRAYPKGATIIDFIQGPVRNFFLSQTYFDLTGKWLFGERSHNVDGVFEYYEEELGTNDPATITRFMMYLSKKVVKGHWDCFCDSGKRMRNCHFPKLLEMREKIPQEVAARSLKMLVKAIEEYRRRKQVNAA
jgi:hypothetical protein